MRTSPLTLFLLLIALPALAQQPASDLEQGLAWSTYAGQQLHSYHTAHHAAIQAIEEQAAGPAEMPPLFAARPDGDGWAFGFGALNDEDAFLITYGVIVEGDGAIDSFSHFETPREASPYHTQAARALRSVITAFQRRMRLDESFEAADYRVAVLPFPEGEFTAFVSPSQTSGSVIHAGNDVMYSIDRTHSTILEKMRFHHRLISVPMAPPADLSGETDMPALIVPNAPIPSPVDVLHAMERNTSLALLTKHGAFVIEPGGAITPLPDNDPLAEALHAQVD